MDKLSNRVEFFANLAIIILAVLCAMVILKTYFLPGPLFPVSKNVETGVKLSLQDTDWNQRDQTVLLALKRDCRFCSESADFYKRLVQTVNEIKRIQVVALLPDTVDDSKNYLRGLGLEISDVKQIALNSVHVKATPTIIVVNNQGIVTNSWVGKLSREKESEVLNQLIRP